MTYYVSDLHFGDLIVFKKCLRPFADLIEYEKEIIKRWNRKVTKYDDVYVLGDVAEDKYDKVFNILPKLHGNKHLIVGNHDLGMIDKYLNLGLFQSVEFIKLIEDNLRDVCLCHYPVMDWINFSKGGYLVYGHIHNKTLKNDIAYMQIKEYYKDKLAFNASVDVTNYEPVTLDEMIKLKEQNINETYIN